MVSGGFSTVVVYFVAACVGFVAGHYYRMVDCPKVLVKKDFDMNQFVGEWYVVAKFNPIATCNKYQVWKKDGGSYAFNETSRLLGLNIRWDGHQSKERNLKILSNGTDAIFRVQQPFSVGTYGVIDTDYESFAMVWGCDPAILGSVQNLDVLSRTPEMDKSILREKLQEAEKMGIDIKLIERVDHRRCVPSTDKDDTESPKEIGINNMFVENE